MPMTFYYICLMYRNRNPYGDYKHNNMGPQLKTHLSELMKWVHTRRIHFSTKINKTKGECKNGNPHTHTQVTYMKKKKHPGLIASTLASLQKDSPIP